ncbi:MAG: hypothetical protein QM820_26160 [Minicystis sp.]
MHRHEAPLGVLERQVERGQLLLLARQLPPLPIRLPVESSELGERLRSGVSSLNWHPALLREVNAEQVCDGRDERRAACGVGCAPQAAALVTIVTISV